MIVYTTRLTIKKAVLGLAVLGAILWGITSLAPHAAESVAAKVGTTSISEKLKTNEDRVEYLHSFGWTVENTPVMEIEVQIPEEFDEAYQAYNEIQLRQGLDLSKYQGKRANVYVYLVVDYPTGEEDVVATIVQYKNKVIAADISSSEAQGFQHGLTERPSVAAQEQGAVSQQPAQEEQTKPEAMPEKTAAEQTPSEQITPKEAAPQENAAAESKQQENDVTPSQDTQNAPSGIYVEE